MCHLRSTLFGLATLFGAVTSAYAGAGSVPTAVTALAPNVTYSSAGTQPLVAYIGYEVSIGRGSTDTNTVNNIVFTGGASATDTAEKPTFFSAEGATCVTTNADNTAISCSIGTLRAGESYPTFAVFFMAPVKVVNEVADAPGTDFAKFSGITYYAEGTGGVHSPPQNSTVLWTANDVLLGTSDPTSVKSSVPKSGGNFFTGSGVSTGADPFATTLDVPSALTYTAQAEIKEETFSSLTVGGINNAPLTCTNFSPCWSSAVTLPGSFGHLTIVLRQDASTIRPGTKIGSVKIWYDGADTTGDSFHGYLGDCPSPTTPLSDRPCIVKATYYKNKSVLGWTAALNGDFEWIIIANKNGRYGTP